MQNGMGWKTALVGLGCVTLTALLGGCPTPPPVDVARVTPYASEGAATMYGTPLSVQNTAQFIGYVDTYPLTADQEAIKKEALTALAAPCCDDFSMYTCCCPCNLALSVWGLSNYLVAEKGLAAESVREAALEWLRFIRPDYYRMRELADQGVGPRARASAGVSCYSGGCERPFSQGGCGGMGALRLE